MKIRQAIIVATLVSVFAGVSEAAGGGVGATDVLYMQASEWGRSSPDDKLALSAAFMRIFCADARMAPEQLVSCIDGDGRSDGVLERALACSATLSRS